MRRNIVHIHTDGSLRHCEQTGSCRLRKAPPVTLTGDAAGPTAGSVRLLGFFLDARLRGDLLALERFQTATTLFYLIMLFAHIELFTGVPYFCLHGNMKNEVAATLLLAIGLFSNGCSSLPGQTKSKATVAIYLEGSPVEEGRVIPIEIFRAAPRVLHIYRSPTIGMDSFDTLTLRETVDGGHVLHITLNRSGTLYLENLSISQRGKRLVIGASFGENNPQLRWLSALLISEKISNGNLIFTPDASIAECKQIVDGVNKKMVVQPKPKAPKKTPAPDKPFPTANSKSPRK